MFANPCCIYGSFNKHHGAGNSADKARNFYLEQQWDFFGAIALPVSWDKVPAA